MRRHLVAGFLKSDEHAGFVEFGGAADQKFHGEHGFAAPGAAANDGRASGRKTAGGDLVETSNPSSGFFEKRSGACGRCSFFAR